MPLVPAWRVDRTFDYSVPADLAGKIGPGILVRVPFGHRRVRGIVTAVRREALQGQESRVEASGEARALQEIAGVVLPTPVVAPEEDVATFEWLARRYVTPRGRAYARAVPPRVRAGVPRPGPPADGPDPSRILTYEAGERLIDALASGAGGAWCLRTAPGADHAALVAECVAACVRAGRGALVAVPEVAHGSGMLSALSAIWPGLARVDSAVSDGTRSRSWAALATGAPVGGGGRNAVLAPSPHLGLIVADEEHNPTFKEDRSPRFDARVAALHRARRLGAVCLLISSTPSLEAIAAAGPGRTLRPPRSVERARRPLVEVAVRPEGRALSPALHGRVRDALRAGGKVALLAPRRGFARAVWCAECRRSVRCPRCEAAMSLDRGPRRVRCPRCGFTTSPPSTCPTCGARDFRFMGAGSERLAEQVAAAWPRARVVRVDPDTRLPDPATTLDADIYLTTWFGTKPALRPEVSLVGVLDADALIHRPDFRAAERAYQALAAMAEWAGPARSGGRLMIQTSDAGHHAVQSVIRADFEFFWRHETATRRELSYPPYCELVKVSGVDRAGVAGAAETCRAAGARVLGPIAVAAAIPVRFEVLIKCDDAMTISDALRPLAATGAGLRFDVDPR